MSYPVVTALPHIVQRMPYLLVVISTLRTAHTPSGPWDIAATEERI